VNVPYNAEKVWTAEDEQRFRELREQKKTHDECAKILGRSRCGCVSKARRIGIPYSDNPRNGLNTPKYRAKVKELQRAGLTAKKIMEATGLSEKTVRRHMKNTGVKAPAVTHILEVSPDPVVLPNMTTPQPDWLQAFKENATW
jgi:hypothetical protein